MRFVKGHWQLGLLTVLVFALWATPVMTPLKILIVFLHELAHVIATVLTGGRVVSLSLSPEQGGMVISQGGNRFMILTAGYLGSLCIGVSLFYAALRTNADRVVVAGLGMIMLLVGAFYIRTGFAIAVTVAMGVGFLASARFLGHAFNDLMLRLIGLTSMVYVPFDIFSDTIARAQVRSDARMLAEEFGGPTMLWGAVWLVISLAVIATTLRRGLGSSSNLAPPRKAAR